MNNSNEIDQSEFSLILKFKELSQQYFQLSAKSSLSDDELDLIDSILERAQDNKILSDLISDCDHDLHGRTLLPDKDIVNSLRNQALQILESIGDNTISDATSRLDNLALLRANGVSDPKLKFIYNLGFYSGIDILSFDSISGNPDLDLEKTIESFGDSVLSRNDVNCPLFPEDPTSNNIEVSNSSREQFIDQIIDLYSPRDECANLVREYFYISSGSVVSETQADRVEEILDQSQTDPILRSFIGEIDRWILEGANLMNPERCKEYASQKLELKAFVQNQQIPLDAAIACQLPSSLVLSSEDKNRLTKSEQTCFNVNPFWKNPLQQVGNSLWANMTNALSNPRLLGTVCLTTMAGAFVSLLFLNSKCFNAFLDKDSPSEQRSAISFLSSGDVSSTDQQNHSNSANVLSLQRDGIWQNSHPATMITASNPSQVYELVSALESGQSLSENRQLSSEWNQKSAEARQLMAESYQKFAETQQLLASTRQIKAEDQQQQTRAEFWLTKAQEWRDLSTKWANQAVIEKSQAEAYLQDSQRYLSRARQYSLATDAARSGEVKVVSTSREKTPSLNSKLDRLEGDSLWTLSHDVLFAGHLAVVAMSAIGLGVSIGVRKSQQTAR